MGWQNQYNTILIMQPSGGQQPAIFIYSAAPGANTLADSITPAQQQDGEGNLALKNITAYGLATPGVWVASQLTDGFLNFATASSEAGPWTSVGFVTQDNNGQLALHTSDTTKAVTVPSNTLTALDDGQTVTCWPEGTQTLTIDVTNSTTSNQSEMGFNVTAGHIYRYAAHCYCTNVAANSMFVGIASPALTLNPPILWTKEVTGANPAIAAVTPPGDGTFTDATAFVHMYGFLEPSAPGTLAVRFRSGTNGNTVTLKAGTHFSVKRIG